MVIAVKNEENSIGSLLNALKKQSYKKENFELIIVNDKSSDNTLNILNEHCLKFKNLKIIDIEKTPKNWDNKIWALNEGIRLSKGEIILSTDGDCIPNNIWILNMVSQFKLKSVGVVASFTPFRGNSLFNKILEYDSLAQDALCGLALA